MELRLDSGATDADPGRLKKTMDSDGLAAAGRELDTEEASFWDRIKAAMDDLRPLMYGFCWRRAVAICQTEGQLRL